MDLIRYWLALFILILGSPLTRVAFAAVAPPSLSLGGELTKADQTPVVSASVNFRLQVYNAAETCVLYSEEHLAEDLSASAGRFNLLLGQGSSRVNNVGSAGQLDAKIFANPGAVAVANCGAVTTVNLSPGDARLIRVQYDLGSGYVAMSPSVPIESVAYALVAETLNGLTSSNFIQANGTSSLSQANQEYAFSLTNWPRLKALLDGTSSQYLPSTPTSALDLNGQKITDLADPTLAQDAATKHYVDANVGGKPLDLTGVGPSLGGGSTLVWDQVANKWVAGTVSSSPTGTAGGDLAGTYPNPTIKNDAITAAKINSTGVAVNRLIITDASTGANLGYGTCSVVGQVYAWTATGWACTNVATLAPVTSVAGKTGVVTLNAGDVSGLGTAALFDWGTAASQIVRLDSSARLPVIDGSQLTRVNAVQLQGRDVASVAPTTGQVLGWNGSAWVPSAVGGGSLTLLASGTGLLGGPITSTGTLAVDVGTTANKILQLNASAQVPAVDGSLLTFVNATKLQTRAVASTAPTSGQVLGWNSSSSQWEPTSGTTGSVTSVATANGLLGGPITSTGTLSIDAGTAPNQIVQLNGSAQLPAVDGSLVTQVNAVNLQSRAVASVAPNAGQVLGWNAVSSRWEPTSTATGSLTSVASGIGLLGGPITSTGTLSVNVGTAPNQIVQENANAQIAQAAGSAALPPYAFVGNENSGIFSPGAGQIAVVANGSAALNISTGGNIGVGTASPNSKLHLSGGNLTVDKAYYGPGIQINYASTTSGGGPAISAVQSAPNGGLSDLFISRGATDGIAGIAMETTGVANTSASPGWIAGLTGLIGSGGGYNFTIASVSGQSMGTSGNGMTFNPFFTIQPAGNVGIGTSLPQAALEINATGSSSALIIPRDTTFNRPTGVNGMLRYNTDSAKFEGFAGGLWSTLASGSSAGTLTSIASGTGLLGGPITTTGTLSVDVGTSANKVLQLNASAQIPAVDGSLVSSINAVKLQTRTIAATIPFSGAVLGWNATASQWEPTLGTNGAVTSIATANGILGGPITSTGTVSIDSGTAANKILQLNASAQVPAVDGSLLTQINAVNIQSRKIAATVPTGGQVLGWNAVGSQWEPVSTAVGSVTSIATGIGLTGGPIATTGTISVDVGTAANKILQLNASARIPAVDGSQLTQINAVSLQSRAISTVAPSGGQVLAWNNSASQWEPTLAASGGGTANSMITNAYDAITCNYLGNTYVYNLVGVEPSNLVYRQNVNNNGDSYVIYARSNGAYSAASGLGYYGDCVSYSLSQLASLGRAFNFVNGNGSSQWTTSASNIWFNTGNVGIGTSAPGAPLDINGAVRLRGSTSGYVGLQASATAPNVTWTLPASDGSSGQVLQTNGAGTLSFTTPAPSVTAVIAPSFSANNGANTQSITSGMWTKMVFPATTFDTINGWSAANNRYTPSVAGKYVFNGNVYCPGNTSQCVGAIYKNGVPASYGSTIVTSGSSVSTATVILDMNGTSDYVESYGYLGSTTTVGGSIAHQYFSGALLAPLASGSIAGTGSTNYVPLWSSGTTQTNSPLAVAGGNVGIGTTAPGALLDLGNVGSQLGTLRLAGSTSGFVQIQPAAAAGSWTMTLPGSAGTSGQVLTTNGSGTLSWTNAAAGGVTGIATGTGLLGGPIATTGTLSVDVGTVANKVVQLNASAQLPAIDASLLTAVNAAKLQSWPILAATPTVGQVLGWNNAASRWEPTTPAASGVTSLLAGAGLLGGTITGSGTLNVDVGTTGNKILQLNSSAQIPAVDGSQLTQVNAASLQTRPISSAAPTAGQVLAWNAMSTKWEPTAPAAGGPSPVFIVNKNNIDQSVTANTWTQLTWGNVVVDSNANFSSDRFTPTVAGRYQINLAVFCPGSTLCSVVIQKNAASCITSSAIIAQGYATSNDSVSNISTLVDMNGSTDFLMTCAFNGGGTKFGGATANTFFNGSLINGGGGSGNSQWTTGGGGIYYGSGAVGIGTTAPAAKLDVAGEIKLGNTSSTCNAMNEGQQRYNSSSKRMEFCNGSAWLAMAIYGGSFHLFNSNGVCRMANANTGACTCPAGTAGHFSGQAYINSPWDVNVYVCY